ncbi:MAG: chloride channel protein [Salinisphaera sp.]|jgi:CIC family chloride channel protein|nr:chloride channel protein [Salinisphaera sp.]
MRTRRRWKAKARRIWQQRLDVWRQQLADVENTPGLGLLCVLGAITGALAGLAIMLLFAGIQAIRLPLFNLFDDHGQTFVDANLAFRVIVPTLGALLLGLIVEWRLKLLENGIVHIIERLMYYQGVLPVRTAIIDLAVSALSIATGQSVGREGTAAHAGATTGSWLARWLGLPNNSVRTLVGCGTAAGIAASFNTPLAAVVFAMEVVMMEYTIAGFAPIILAAVTGSLTTFSFADMHPHLVGQFNHFSGLELPYVALVGVLLGILGGGFTRLTGAVVTWLSRLRPSLRMTLAGLVTGILAIAYPEIMGLGYATVNEALSGQFEARVALGIGVAKLVATLFAVGATMPGGIILPMFVVGATLGSAFGVLGNLLLPAHTSNSGLYALLGIGAMMAAVLQAPLSALVAILELSGQTEMVLPGMLTVISALVISRRIAASDSYFRLLLRRRGLDYRNDPISQYLRRASVLTVMNRRYRQVEPKLSRAHLRRIVEDNIDWLLVRPRQGRAFLMRLDELKRVLAQQAAEAATDESKLVDDTEATIDLTNVPAHRADAFAIDVRASLQEAYDRFEQSEAEALIVQRNSGSGSGRVVTYGILTPDSVAATSRRAPTR